MQRKKRVSPAVNNARISWYWLCVPDASLQRIFFVGGGTAVMIMLVSLLAGLPENMNLRAGGVVVITLAIAAVAYIKKSVLRGHPSNLEERG